MSWQIILGVLAALWFVRRIAKRGGASGVTGSDGLTPEQRATAQEASANWPGGNLIDPHTIVPADQTLYPGFYTSPMGGYYNPTTGDSYSPGSSPVVYRETYASVTVDQSAGVRAAAASAVKTADPAETKALGYDVVY